MGRQLHTVLGGSGAVGYAVVQELARRKLDIRVVERSKDVQGFETVRADLLDPAQAAMAVKDSAYVYLCVGVPYNHKIWQAQWPVVMRNVLDACAEAKARLVFLDNIYMYGPDPLRVPFDESHPQEPPSKKGKVRKAVADMLLDAHRSGKIKAVIGRSADFYGPKARNSLLFSAFLENMLRGKEPQWLASPSARHNYAFTPDLGRALVTLALADDAYGQVWHLPVGDPILPREAAELYGKALDRDFRLRYMPGVLLKLLSLFVPILREVREMSYQFNNDYLMSWEKYKARFPDFLITPYEEGIRETVDSFR